LYKVVSGKRASTQPSALPAMVFAATEFDFGTLAIF
jgi:hypothetical protein